MLSSVYTLFNKRLDLGGSCIKGSAELSNTSMQLAPARDSGQATPVEGCHPRRTAALERPSPALRPGHSPKAGVGTLPYAFSRYSTPRQAPPQTRLRAPGGSSFPHWRGVRRSVAAEEIRMAVPPSAHCAVPYERAPTRVCVKVSDAGSLPSACSRGETTSTLSSISSFPSALSTPLAD